MNPSPSLRARPSLAALRRFGHRGVPALPALAAIAALTLAPARAQVQLAEYTIAWPFGWIGDRVGLAGDVNGDGRQDLLVAGTAAQGVFTYSGADGAQLHYLETGTSAQKNVTSPGDVNGDGQPDIVTADGSVARCWSRADGSELWSVAGSLGGNIGWTMAALGDVDGDGIGDVALGEPHADPSGIVSGGIIHVLQGQSGAPIHLFQGTSANQQVGKAMCGLDFDGSRGLEVAMGETSFVLGGSLVGRVLIRDAATGAQLFVHVGVTPDIDFGINVADAGDLDGDGQHDIAIASVSGFQGIVDVRSTADDHLIWSRPGVEITHLVSVGDANGDGLAELAAGEPGFLDFPGHGTVLDGASGVALGSGVGSTPGSFVSMAAPGDVTGDGVPDLLIGDEPMPWVGDEAASASLNTMPSFALNYVITNPAGGQQLGSGMDASADFDHDGHQDYVIGSDERFLVFSGATGAVLLDKPTPDLAGSQYFGGSSALAVIGDYDQDGTPDIATANPQYSVTAPSVNGRLMVLSGADGDPLYDEIGAADTALGRAVAATDDLDGDGVGDVWVSLPDKAVNGFKDAGEVQLRSGANLATVLASYHGIPQKLGRFGLTLNAGGDVNGDGVRDVAVGSSEDPPGVTNGPGTTAVLSGATGAELYRFEGTALSNDVYSAIVGDADGDDVPDILVAEPGAVLPPETSQRGRLRLFAGATGAMLWSKYGDTPNNKFSRGFGGAGDVNGDGYADVAASATAVTPATSSGTVWILSGKTAAVLDTIVLPLTKPGATNGGTLVSAGLHDAGGCADLLVSMPWLNNNGGARIYASSAGGIHGFVDLGLAKQGTGVLAPSLRFYGDLAANQLVTAKARHALPLKSCVWLVGLAQGNLPFKGGIMVPSPSPPFFAFPLGTDANGEFSLTSPNPAGVFAGLTLFHQFWFSDPGAPQKVSATNGVKEIFK
jgi:hypothetical protein